MDRSKTRTLEIDLSVFEAMFEQATYSKEQTPLTLATNISNLEDLQLCCRCCGRIDDNTFVDLDEEQNFDFDPSINNYRSLFQRTSLQFQFHTMPNLPTRICARCCYKIKIFYCLTRQFVLNQNSMRATITEWYRNNHWIEPPEQATDLKRVNEELAAADPELLPPPPLPQTATKNGVVVGCKERVASCLVQPMPQEMPKKIEQASKQTNKNASGANKIARINALAKLKSPPFICHSCGWEWATRADLIAHCGVRTCCRSPSQQSGSLASGRNPAQVSQSARAKSLHGSNLQVARTQRQPATAREVRGRQQDCNAAAKKLFIVPTRQGTSSAPLPTYPRRVASALSIPARATCHTAAQTRRERTTRFPVAEPDPSMPDVESGAKNECIVPPRIASDGCEPTSLQATGQGAGPATTNPVPPSRAQLQRQQNARCRQWR
ncbi:uncharacterized protein LOC115631845 [Scaptodrosophila lebanonensis]|uniref:Uncharacterized protein LOC115631845 n=1 Tax=Drosophila lebanonensis TaxID=7225 RepID=A0A6J2UAP0_DROLE|nr:uncharacterized protein LOC115631845 [Scaptodrosophila lebanonensis]